MIFFLLQLCNAQSRAGYSFNLANNQADDSLVNRLLKDTISDQAKYMHIYSEYLKSDLSTKNKDLTSKVLDALLKLTDEGLKSKEIDEDIILASQKVPLSEEQKKKIALYNPNLLPELGSIPVAVSLKNDKQDDNYLSDEVIGDALANRSLTSYSLEFLKNYVIENQGRSDYTPRNIIEIVKNGTVDAIIFQIGEYRRVFRSLLESSAENGDSFFYTLLQRGLPERAILRIVDSIKESIYFTGHQNNDTLPIIWLFAKFQYPNAFVKVVDIIRNNPISSQNLDDDLNFVFDSKIGKLNIAHFLAIVDKEGIMIAKILDDIDLEKFNEGAGSAGYKPIHMAVLNRNIGYSTFLSRNLRNLGISRNQLSTRDLETAVFSLTKDMSENPNITEDQKKANLDTFRQFRTGFIDPNKPNRAGEIAIDNLLNMDAEDIDLEFFRDFMRSIALDPQNRGRGRDYPLHRVVNLRNLELIRAFSFSVKIDWNIKSAFGNGETPLTRARRLGAKEVEQFLRSRGAVE